MVKPVRRRIAEFEKHVFAGRRREPVKWGFADDSCAIRVGDNETGAFWNEISREIGRDRKEKAVAMVAVALPFLVGPEILNR